MCFSSSYGDVFRFEKNAADTVAVAFARDIVDHKRFPVDDKTVGFVVSKDTFLISLACFKEALMAWR